MFSKHLLLSLVLLTIRSAQLSEASTVSEAWCKLRAYDITDIMRKKYLFGRGRMSTTSFFESEMRNDSSMYAVTEIEIKVTGTYDSFAFERVASTTLFLEPGESERVIIQVDSSLGYSKIKMDKWKITKIIGCAFN